MRVLYPRPPRHPIQFIHTPQNRKIYNTLGISSSFRQYYSQIYNLPPLSGGSLTPSQPDFYLLAYITETALPVVSIWDASDLDKPLLEQEFLGAIKGLKSGKCPDEFSPTFALRFWFLS